jgi:hypothetical protein
MQGPPVINNFPATPALADPVAGVGCPTVVIGSHAGVQRPPVQERPPTHAYPQAPQFAPDF